MHPGYLILIFCALFAVVLLAITAGTRYFELQRKNRVAEALKTVSGAAPDMPATRILNDDSNENSFSLFRQLSESPLLRHIQSRIYQAGMTIPATTLLMQMALGALAGILLAAFVRIPLFRQFAFAGLAFLFGAIPYWHVLYKRHKRLASFEEQFPEALDFLARSLRAGHAFSVSLEMMADESPDPIGAEFRQLFNEQNLGSPIDVAMRNLARRVPLIDVRFFVSAILLQRETGGNLAEILNKLAYVIRERFRIKGQIRAVSAHGRLTAGVLTVLPVATVLGLMALNPGYIESMATDEDGRWLVVGACIAQTLGYYVMRRIVNIKV
jgi:tight adherence protein B